MDSRTILAMNIKYYRLKYNLSQERLAEISNCSLVYINQVENEDRNVSIDILDKLKDGLNNEFHLNLTSSDLLKYDESHITNYSRIDEKK